MVSLTTHTRSRARGKGNRNPERMLRNMLPGIAKVCRLKDSQGSAQKLVSLPHSSSTIQSAEKLGRGVGNKARIPTTDRGQELMNHHAALIGTCKLLIKRLAGHSRFCLMTYVPPKDD